MRIKELDPQTRIILAYDRCILDRAIEEKVETTAGQLVKVDCGECENIEGIVSFGQQSVFLRIKSALLDLPSPKGWSEVT